MSPREAVATYLGEDYADMKDREYQPGRTGGVAVYTYADFYLFALRAGSGAPPKLQQAFPDMSFEHATGTVANHLALISRKQVWIIRSKP